MKRIFVIMLAVIMLAGLAGCAANKPTETPEPTASEYTAEDINDKLIADIDKVMTSLGIIDYEIVSVENVLESSTETTEDYVFDYEIKAAGVDLMAHGRGYVMNMLGGATNAGLAYVARSMDNKIVWASTPGDLYDWQTGELKP